MISRKVPKECADLLTRAKATGLKDDDIHDRAGLARGWLSGARRGRYGPQAEGWAKLRRFLDRFESGAREMEESPPGALTFTCEPGLPVGGGGGGGEPVVVLSPDDGAATPIGEAMLNAKTFKRLGSLIASIGAAVADNRMDLKRAETLERLAKTRASVLKQEQAEKHVAKVRSLEILTADEVRLLEEHRAKMAGPPLNPGDYPQPPSDALPAEPESGAPNGG